MSIILNIFLVGLFSFGGTRDGGELPKVIILGEYEKEYSSMQEGYNSMLLDACDADLNKAFGLWLTMLRDMENFSQEIDYSLDGAKIWLNVYWSKTGKIEHIAYYLKSDSKLFDEAELKAFFSSFMNHYQLPLIASEGYYHSGSASFPVAYELMKISEKNEE